MNYANSSQLAYNIGDNQQLAYAALKTIRRRRSPSPTLGLMYGGKRRACRRLIYMQEQHANYSSGGGGCFLAPRHREREVLSRGRNQQT